MLRQYGRYAGLSKVQTAARSVERRHGGSRRASPRWLSCRFTSTLTHDRPATDQEKPNIKPKRRNPKSTPLDLPALDIKWRQKWQENPPTIMSSEDGGQAKRRKYILPMFPYPSGTLHLGHLRVYTIADVIARYEVLKGNDVMLPMGWDAFGLPAENAALQRGIAPATWTRDNIARMKAQLETTNGSWDWSRELATCNADFYKHTQKIFLMLLEEGLAYRAEAEVNYDPVDQTVLANEQVDDKGCSWRSGAKVEKRRLKQWFLRITSYQEELLDGLKQLGKDGDWPDRVVSMQRNWLGKSSGAVISFKTLSTETSGGHGPPQKGGKHPPSNVTWNKAIDVFTTRPETLYGVKYIAIAPTHPAVVTLAKTDPALQSFLATLSGLPPDSKAGHLLRDLRVLNPAQFLGDALPEAHKPLPVYVAPYVLGDYGEGAVMGVPDVDARDRAFWSNAQRTSSLSGGVQNDKPVEVAPAASSGNETTAAAQFDLEPLGQDPADQVLRLQVMDDASLEKARGIVVAALKKKGFGSPQTKFRLRDWLISRQRYWGTPIPVVHCGSCGVVPVPDEQLPVQLPEVDAHWAEGKVGNPLESATDWVNTSCPKCGGEAKRETDTMDTFMDSSWYYMRFADPHNATAPISAEAFKHSLPVDKYIGGVEHAILHLLYARFIYKFMRDQFRDKRIKASEERKGYRDLMSKGVVQHREPFSQLISQGMVHGKTYVEAETGRFLRPDEVDLADPQKPKMAETGEEITVKFEKMSKSKFNGVDPTGLIAKYGADATRAHMLFQAPVDQVLNWDEQKIVGVTRWMQRLYDLVLLTASRDNGQDGFKPATAEEEQEETDKSESDATSPANAGVNAQAIYVRDAAEKTSFGREENEHHLEEASSISMSRKMRSHIQDIRDSYDDVYSLNTVISSLMSATNIVERRSRASLAVVKPALSVIVRLMAPIAPAFAEECWSLLSPGRGSVFAAGVPEIEEAVAGLKEPRRPPTIVQVNGKFRQMVQLQAEPEGLKGDERMQWYSEQIAAAMLERNELATRLQFAERVVVVKDGRLVNFVFRDNPVPVDPDVERDPAKGPMTGRKPR
jgi:leucyl-tRNA synthetase